MRVSIFIILSFTTLSLRSQPYTCIKTIEQHSSPIESMMLKGSLLYTGDFDGRLNCWLLPELEWKYEINAHKNRINTIDQDVSGTYLLTASSDWSVRVWRGKEMLKEYITESNVSFALFSPDGQRLYYGCHDGNLYCVDWKTDRKPYVVYSCNFYLTSGYMIKEKGVLLFAAGYTTKLFSVRKNKVMEQTPNCSDFVNQLAYDGKDIYSWCENGTLNRYVFENSMLKLAKSKSSGENGYSKIGLSNNLKEIVTGNESGMANIWSMPDLVLKEKINAHSQNIKQALFFDRDSLLITSAYDGLIKLWKRPKIKEPATSEISFKQEPEQKKRKKKSAIKKNAVSEKTILPKDANINETLKDDIFSEELAEDVKKIFSSPARNAQNINKPSDPQPNIKTKSVISKKRTFKEPHEITTPNIKTKEVSSSTLNNSKKPESRVYETTTNTDKKPLQAKTPSTNSSSEKKEKSINRPSSELSEEVNIRPKKIKEEPSLHNKSRAKKPKPQAQESDLDWLIQEIEKEDPKEIDWRKVSNKKLARLIKEMDSLCGKPPTSELVFETIMDLEDGGRKAETQHTITVWETDIVLSVWDHQKEDGDIISLYLNNELVLNNYLLTKNKKLIRLFLEADEINELKLFAENLGQVSPNTASMQIVQKGKIYNVVLRSDMKKCGILKIKYAAN